MAREFTELIAWQLARDLKLRVYELIKQPKVARDSAFVAQIVDAAASAPRNIAEGFGRFNRREFAHFLKLPSRQSKRYAITSSTPAIAATSTEVNATARLNFHVVLSRQPPD